MDDKPWSGLRAWIYSFIFRTPKSNRLIVDLAGLHPTDHTLDIGCGPGAAVRLAAGIVSEGSAAGVDRSEPMVEIARKRSADLDNVEFEVGSAELLPFPDVTFTVVWTVHSFHHWEDRRAGLTEMFRVLRAGGRAIIVEQDEKKHGLTAEQARRVASDMEAIGFGPVVVDRVDGQVVITGTRS
ncbi:MAG: methyltransferase domain-containing protein [Acidimicrobiia bacterium]|nr:methyltransferase domain-containing protein [Acidimicrobiia bacterium]NNL69967.1 methyltransferase domain-containing protein [Acidimicrobiia bacterium]